MYLSINQHHHQYRIRNGTQKKTTGRWYKGKQEPGHGFTPKSLFMLFFLFTQDNDYRAGATSLPHIFLFCFGAGTGLWKSIEMENSEAFSFLSSFSHNPRSRTLSFSTFLNFLLSYLCEHSERRLLVSK